MWILWQAVVFISTSSIAVLIVNGYLRILVCSWSSLSPSLFQLWPPVTQIPDKQKGICQLLLNKQNPTNLNTRVQGKGIQWNFSSHSFKHFLDFPPSPLSLFKVILNVARVQEEQRKEYEHKESTQVFPSLLNSHKESGSLALSLFQCHCSRYWEND